MGLPDGGGRPPDDVEDRGAAEHEGERRDDGEQAPRPGRLPGGEEEPDGEGDVEGAELPGDVDGRTCALAEQHGGAGEHQLGEGDHEQGPPGDADRLGAPAGRRGAAGRGAAPRMAAVRSGTGSASRTRTMRWSTASSSAQAAQARHVPRWASTASSLSSEVSPSSRAESASRIASHRMEGRSLDWGVWFPGVRLGPWTT